MKTLNLPLVKASLARAESELGHNAPFDDVLARARQLTPDAFGNLLEDYDSKGSSQKVHASAASDAGTETDRFYRDIAAATFGELASEEEAKAFLEEYGPDGKKTPAQRAEEREKAEAKEADEANKELEKRAKQLVASGTASSMEDGLIQAMHADSALYVAASRSTIDTSENVRKETLEQLRDWRKATQPSGWSKLFDDSLEIRRKAPTISEDEAFLRACEQDPIEFQRWKDSIPKGSAVAASDFEGKARALVTAGQASSIEEAFGLIAASDSSAYSDYLKALH